MGNIFSNTKQISTKSSLLIVSEKETVKYEKYENIEKEFKELLYVIDETNDIMHFYKSIKDSNIKLQKFKEFKSYSVKSLKYFEYFKDTIFDEYETTILDINIKNYYDMSIFVNNAYYHYNKTPEYKKKYLLDQLYNLLHSTLYLLIKDDLMI